MPKIYNGPSRRRYRTPRVTIQALARGYLGRIEARRRRDDREIMDMIREPEPYTGDPNLQWLQGMAGAGSRPMAARNAIPNPLPYAGSTAVARADLPGYANMGRRIPVGFTPSSSNAINTPNERRRFNKEQKSLWEFLKRKS